MGGGYRCYALSGKSDRSYANMIKESDMPFNMKDLKMLGSPFFRKR